MIVLKDKNVIYELSRKNIKTQYRGSFLGYLWTVLNPLLTMLVMWIVFDKLFGFNDKYYSIYLLTGNVLFGALRIATTQALTSLYNNRGILLRTKIEPYVFPCSFVVSALINFFFSLVALIPFMIWLSIQQGINLFTYRLLFIFLMLPAFWLFEYGIGLFLSVLYVFFKDVFHLYSVFILLWQYLTPVFYKIDKLGDGPASYIVRANPMFHFLTYFRECVYMGAIGADPLTGVVSSVPYLPEWSKLGYVYIFGFASLIIGVLVYLFAKQKILMKL